MTEEMRELNKIIENRAETIGRMKTLLKLREEASSKSNEVVLFVDSFFNNNFDKKEN